MTRYLVTARSATGTLRSIGSLTGSVANDEIARLKSVGYDHITLTDIDKGERVADLERLKGK